MLKNIGLIIVCNLLMYLILLLIWKFVKIKNKRQSNYKHKNDQVNVLNDKVNELEKKIFIQDILNHASLENEINEKIYYANKIIETYKDEAIGYYYRGNLYVKFEKYDEAIKDFEKTLEIDENFKEAYRGKGLCLARKGYYYEALQNYKKAIEIDKNYEVVYYNMGVCYSRLKKYTKAINAYTKALNLDKKDVSAY